MINTQEHIQGLPRSCEATSVRAVAFNCCFHWIKRNSTIIIFQIQELFTQKRKVKSKRNWKQNNNTGYFHRSPLYIFFSKVPVTVRCQEPGDVNPWRPCGWSGKKWYFPPGDAMVLGESSLPPKAIASSRLATPGTIFNSHWIIFVRLDGDMLRAPVITEFTSSHLEFLWVLVYTSIYRVQYMLLI